MICCLLKKSLFSRRFLFGFLFCFSVLFGSLSPLLTSPASAAGDVTASGPLRTYWFGFVQPGISSYSDYFAGSGWQDVGEATDLVINDATSGGSGSYVTPINFSYCASLPVHSSWQNLPSTVTVTVPFDFVVKTTTGTDFISKFDKTPYLTKDFVQASIETSLPSNSPIVHPSYNLDLSKVVFTDFSYLRSDASYFRIKASASITFDTTFSGSPSFLGDTAQYYFCYRLNGNNNTNGGLGFAWAKNGVSFWGSSSLKPAVYSNSATLSYAIHLADPVADPDKISSSLDNLTEQVTGAIKGTTDAIDKNTSAVDKNTEAIDNQTEQIVGAIKDGQQAEKDEQDQREEQGKEDADQAAGAFSFTVLNPFAGIFGLFSSSQCVQISTLASWLHVEDPQVCAWFPASVRNVLTPVFGLSSMMLVFAFVVRWLGGNELVIFGRM